MNITSFECEGSRKIPATSENDFLILVLVADKSIVFNEFVCIVNFIIISQNKFSMDNVNVHIVNI